MFNSTSLSPIPNVSLHITQHRLSFTALSQFHVLIKVASVSKLLETPRTLELLLEAVLRGAVTAQILRITECFVAERAAVVKLRPMRGPVMPRQGAA